LSAVEGGADVTEEPSIRVIYPLTALSEGKKLFLGNVDTKNGLGVSNPVPDALALDKFRPPSLFIQARRNLQLKYATKAADRESNIGLEVEKCGSEPRRSIPTNLPPLVSQQTEFI
jgi:hypothetical protein